MYVVDPDAIRAGETAVQLAQALDSTVGEGAVFDTGGEESSVPGTRKGGFSEFVRSGELDRFVNTLLPGASGA